MIKSYNEYVINDEYAEVILLDRNGKEKARAIVDLDDIEKIKPHKWYYKNGYVFTNISGSNVRLHRYILSSEKGTVVDHINRNGLDNRKSNLRYVSPQENAINRSKQSNNSSGVTGVSYDKSRDKWKAYINFNYKKIDLGLFIKKENAIKARKEAEKKYFGEFIPR